MTVEELRKALEGVDDSIEVVTGMSKMSEYGSEIWRAISAKTLEPIIEEGDVRSRSVIFLDVHKHASSYEVILP